MIKNLFAACAGLAVVSMAGVTDAAVVTQPTSLSPGDQYRLAFITSDTTTATSSSISTYNTFVTNAANGVTELSDLGTAWTAIVSTSTVDARDNTNTNPTLSTGVPIYLLNEAKIADDYGDLWDNTIDAFFNVDEFGNTVLDQLSRNRATIYRGKQTHCRLTAKVESC